MNEKKTLLKKYGIPLNHLDFAYIKECNDAREIERIVHILQSGEEGYYPDLTQCAADKLRLLKPNSRLFRCETPILPSDESESLTIREFARTVRDRDKQLTSFKSEDEYYAPIRTPGKISLTAKEQKDVNIDNNRTSKENQTTEGDQKCAKKISSTDYRKWDKYDPDEEILRMDLAEERQQEEIEIKTREIEKKFQKAPLIEEIKPDEARYRKLSVIERESLAEEYRMRGNDYFRAKEYDSALIEYTKTIKLNSEKDAAAYNNRAITYMKLKKFPDAINDCLKCLSIEPNNVKAMYRLGQSYMDSDFKEKALDMFHKVLEQDPNHTNAKKFVNTLASQVVPSNATRLQIEEAPRETKNVAKKNEVKKSIPPKSKVSEKEKDYDLASLIQPKEIVPNKWEDVAGNMMRKRQDFSGQNDESKTTSNIKTISDQTENENDMKLHLPIFNETAKSNKVLIEEL